MGDLSPPPCKRTKLSARDLTDLSKEEIIEKFQTQQQYVEHLEGKLASQGGDENDEKEKTQNTEGSRRENVLVMRLANKEQEVQDYAAQISVMKKTQDDAAILSLRQANLDPGVNLLFGKMREELQLTKDKLEQAQSELSAWKFTPDSQNGKKLMARCRTLIAENQELGKQLSQGKTAQLEAELALQKKYSEELKASQDELNEFVIQLDEEVEGMQSTIQVLQQQLASAKKDNHNYQQIVQEYENRQTLHSPMGSDRDNEERSFTRDNKPGYDSENERLGSGVENDGSAVSDVDSNMDRTSELDYDDDMDDRTHSEMCDIGGFHGPNVVSGYGDERGAAERAQSPGTLNSESMQSVPKSPGTPTEESMGAYGTWGQTRTSGDTWEERTSPGRDEDDVPFNEETVEASPDTIEEPDIKAHITSVRSPESSPSREFDLTKSSNAGATTNGGSITSGECAETQDNVDDESYHKHIGEQPIGNGENEDEQLSLRNTFPTPPEVERDTLTKPKADSMVQNHSEATQNGIGDEEPMLEEMK